MIPTVGCSSSSLTSLSTVVDIHLHLAEIAVGNLSNLKVDQDIAPEDTVVEDEIYEVVVGIEGKPLLSRFEEEPFAQLKEKRLQFVDDGRFEIDLSVAGLLVQAEKFKNIWVFEHILWLLDDVAGVGEGSHTAPVPAERKPLIQAGVELPFEFRERPAVLLSLDLVEPALFPVADVHQEDVVRPAESNPGGELRRQCLRNWLPGRNGRIGPVGHCLRSQLTVFKVKSAHILKISFGKPSPKLFGQLA